MEVPVRNAKLVIMYIIVYYANASFVCYDYHSDSDEWIGLPWATAHQQFIFSISLLRDSLSALNLPLSCVIRMQCHPNLQYDVDVEPHGKRVITDYSTDCVSIK